MIIVIVGIVHAQRIAIEPMRNVPFNPAHRPCLDRQLVSVWKHAIQVVRQHDCQFRWNAAVTSDHERTQRIDAQQITMDRVWFPNTSAPSAW